MPPMAKQTSMSQHAIVAQQTIVAQETAMALCHHRMTLSGAIASCVTPTSDSLLQALWCGPHQDHLCVFQLSPRELVQQADRAIFWIDQPDTLLGILRFQ